RLGAIPAPMIAGLSFSLTMKGARKGWSPPRASETIAAHWGRGGLPRRGSKLDGKNPALPAQSRLLPPQGLCTGGAGLRRTRVHAAGLRGDLGRGSDRLPSGHALENALGILDRIDVAVALLDHLHRRAHLLGQEVHVHLL